MSPDSWAARRWRDLDRRPAGNAVPGTSSVAVLAGLVALVRLGASAQRDADVAALLLDGAGVACLVAAAAGLYHLCARLDLGRAGRLLAVAVLLVNPDLLGTVADPRSAFLLAGVFPALAGLARWATATRTPSGGELAVYVGAPATVAVFAGYEGWLLVLLVLVVVAVVQLRRGQGAGSALTRVVSVAAVPVVVGGWWLVRGVVRGGPLRSALPALDPTLPASRAVGLVCLLVAVAVLAAISALVRDQLSERRLGARPRLDPGVELPRQRAPRTGVDA